MCFSTCEKIVNVPPVLTTASPGPALFTLSLFSVCECCLATLEELDVETRWLLHLRVTLVEHTVCPVSSLNRRDAAAVVRQ